MARRIIGLDLGAYSVKLLRLETGKQTQKYEIITIAEEILTPDEQDGPSLLDRQKEALGKMHNAGILEAEAYAAGIYSGDGQIRSIAVPFTEPRKIEAILPGLLESEVPFDVSEMVMPWHRPVRVDAAEASQNTIHQIRLGFGKKVSIATTLQLLQNINIDPRILHLSSAAPYEIIREFGLKTFIPEDEQLENETNCCGIIVDFGHRATNLCVFDRNGIVSVHSFYRGGKKLTEEIAKKLEISFAEAELLKHTKLNFSQTLESDEIADQIREVAKAHYQDLLSQIQRICIAHQSNGLGIVKAVAFAGGGAKTTGLDMLFRPLANSNIKIVSLASFFPSQIDPNTMFLSYAYALSVLNLPSKDSRFNFRKDEFVWRGELDFLRTKSVPLVLWGLSVICILTIMWSAQSLVLDKENKNIEEQLKTTCTAILGKPNVPAKKCLASMKEQITSQVDMGIPEFSASDVYLKLAEFLPSSLNIVIQELDILEKRVKIAAQSPSYDDIDKVTGILRKIPCFNKLETGRTEKTDKGVKYNLSFDIDCITNTSSTPSAPAKAG